MSGCSWLTRRRFRRDPTHALFADQSHSIPDNIVALFGRIREWNYSVETARSAVKVSTEQVQRVVIRPAGDAGWGSAYGPLRRAASPAPGEHQLAAVARLKHVAAELGGVAYRLLELAIVEDLPWA